MSSHELATATGLAVDEWYILSLVAGVVVHVALLVADECPQHRR